MQYYSLPTDREEIAIVESFPVIGHLQSGLSRRSFRQ